MADAMIGTGATLTLGTYTVSVNITAVSQGDFGVPVIDTSHLGTTGSRTKAVGKLIDSGSFSCDFDIDSSALDSLKSAIAGGAQTVTVTFPLKSGQSTGATASGSGAITGFSYSIPLEDKITGSFTVNWLGAVTFTDGS